MKTQSRSHADVRLRTIISLTTSWMFVIMGVTGLVLFIVPQGRIAYWVDWHFLGLTKTNWGDIHVVASVFFLVAGGWHLYFNWKAFLNHLRSKISSGVRMKKELFITVGLSGFLVVSALFGIPPVSYIIDLNETIKSSWIESEDFEPPFGHAELLSIERLTRKTHIPLEKALDALDKREIRVESPKETLESIAKNNDLSPKDIFAIIQPLQKTPTFEKTVPRRWTNDDVFERFEGTGIGKLTVRDACEMAGEPLSGCLDRLEQKQIESEADENMKKIADNAAMRPIEVLQAMLVSE